MGCQAWVWKKLDLALLRQRAWGGAAFSRGAGDRQLRAMGMETEDAAWRKHLCIVENNVLYT